MEKLGFGLDDDSASSDQKQTNPNESRMLTIQRCVKYLLHACQCRDANCRLPSCAKVKKIVQHGKLCKERRGGKCPICKQLLALCCYHANNCQEAKCPVNFCINIKHKMKEHQLKQRLQQQQILKRRIATMQNRGASGGVLQTSPENSNSSNQSSPSTQTHSLVYPPQDFDLCVNCSNKGGHIHKMEKLGSGLDNDSASSDQKHTNPNESRMLSIQRCDKYLLHACQCIDANCRLPSCAKVKKIVKHVKLCKERRGGKCPICKQLSALIWYHAKNCQEAKCELFCIYLKNRMKIKQLKLRLQQQLVLKRRIVTMQNRMLKANALLISGSTLENRLKRCIVTMQNRGTSGDVLQTSPDSTQPDL